MAILYSIYQRLQKDTWHFCIQFTKGYEKTHDYFEYNLPEDTKRHMAIVYTLTHTLPKATKSYRYMDKKITKGFKKLQNSFISVDSQRLQKVKTTFFQFCNLL